MDCLLIFLKGLAIGFAMAMPVGPAGILCVRHTLSYGLLAGLLVGLGAALADTFFAALAATGLASLADHLLTMEQQLRFGGGLFLVLLGLWTYRRSGVDPARPAALQGAAMRGAAAGGFLLVLTNPMTLLAFLGFFATFRIVGTAVTPLQIGFLTAGVFLGSGLWWSLLSAGTGRLRRHLDHGLVARINHLAAVAIAGFGVYVLADALL